MGQHLNKLEYQHLRCTTEEGEKEGNTKYPSKFALWSILELVLAEVVEKDTCGIDNSKDGETATKGPKNDAPAFQAALGITI